MKRIAFPSAITLLIMMSVLIAGCSSSLQDIHRSEGKFPLVPAIMNKLENISDDDFDEQLLITREGSYPEMKDLDGWKGYSRVCAERGLNELEIFAEQEQSETGNSWIITRDGSMFEGQDISTLSSGKGKYILNIASNPLAFEEFVLEPVMNSPTYGDEYEVVKELMSNCGIDIEENGINVDNQRYEKASPLNAIIKMNEIDDLSYCFFGSTYELVGEAKTDQGSPLYYKVGMRNVYSIMDFDSSGLSYITIGSPQNSVSAAFSLTEPFELDETDPLFNDVGIVSTSPINDSSVYSYMVMGEDSNASAYSDSLYSKNLNTSTEVNRTESTSDAELYSDNVFPQSSDEYLSESDLYGLSEQEIQRAINELFARNGYIFQSSASEKRYFESQDWYSGDETDQNVVKSRFNKYEKANAKLLEKYRSSM